MDSSKHLVPLGFRNGSSSAATTAPPRHQQRCSAAMSRLHNKAAVSKRHPCPTFLAASLRRTGTPLRPEPSIGLGEAEEGGWNGQARIAWLHRPKAVRGHYCALPIAGTHAAVWAVGGSMLQQGHASRSMLTWVVASGAHER